MNSLHTLSAWSTWIHCASLRLDPHEFTAHLLGLIHMNHCTPSQPDPHEFTAHPLGLVHMNSRHTLLVWSTGVTAHPLGLIHMNSLHTLSAWFTWIHCTPSRPDPHEFTAHPLGLIHMNSRHTLSVWSTWVTAHPLGLIHMNSMHTLSAWFTWIHCTPPRSDPHESLHTLSARSTWIHCTPSRPNSHEFTTQPLGLIHMNSMHTLSAWFTWIHCTSFRPISVSSKITSRPYWCASLLFWTPLDYKGIKWNWWAWNIIHIRYRQYSVSTNIIAMWINAKFHSAPFQWPQQCSHVGIFRCLYLSRFQGSLSAGTSNIQCSNSGVAAIAVVAAAQGTAVLEAVDSQNGYSCFKQFHNPQSFLWSHSSTASQEIPCIFTEANGPLPCSQAPTTRPCPQSDQSIPRHRPISRTSNLILSSHLHLGLPSSLFPSPFPPHQIPVCTSAPCLTQIQPISLFTSIIFGEEQKSLSCLVSSLLQYPVISSIVGPSIFLTILLSNTISTCSFLNVQD